MAAHDVVSGVVPDQGQTFIAFACIHPSIEGVSALASFAPSYDIAVKLVNEFHDQLNAVIAAQ